MRKSILRFGALALMSMVSIGSWAQSIVYDGVNNLYTVVEGTNVKLQSLMAPSSGNALDLSNGFTVGSGNSAVTYTVVGVVAYASNTYSGSDITVTLPSNLSEGVGEFAFAKQGVKVQFKDQKLTGKLSSHAFENATIVSGEVSNPVFHFNDLKLSDHAFYNAAFPGGTSIVLSATLTELPDYVFGAASEPAKNDITRVEFNYPGSITKVGNYALANRTGLTQFGFYTNGNYSLPVTLNEVGDYAFSSCNELTNFGFSTEAIEGEKRPRIATIGKYAFFGCKSWMDNAKFKNLCVSFEDLTFGEGSFQGCNFTSVDLSKWTPIDVTIGTAQANNTQTGKGVPGGAFADNTNLTSLKFGDTEIKVIGEYAFYNTGLTNLVLPKGIEYLGTNAFALGAQQTTHNEIISLPTTLRGIRKDALKNRYINKIFVSPDFSYGDDFNVPQLEDQEKLTVESMQLPTVKRNPIYNKGQIINYQTPKTVFDNAGWKTVDDNKNITLEYAKEFSATPAGNYYYYVIYDGVKYKINTTPNLYHGYFDATVVAFIADDATVHGMIQTKEVKYDALEQGKTVQKTATLKGGDYTYGNIVLNVTGFAETESEESPVSCVLYPKDNKGACTMTSVAFKMDAYPVTEQGNSAAEDFVNIAGTKYTAIPVKMFSSNCTTLTDITLAEGITSVGASAFAGTGITKIDLPASLVAGTVTESDQTLIGSNAFNNGKITTVNIKSHPTGTIVDLPEDAFANGTKPIVGGGTQEDEDHFAAKLVVSGSKYNRSAYLADNLTGWKKFFKLTNTFKEIKAATKTSDPDVVNTVCADENGVFVFDDDVKAVQITEKIGTEAVSETPAVTVPVKYNRSFGNTSWQAISLPFDVPVEKIPEGLEVAELYNIRLNGETGALEAVVWVKLQEDDVMNAFTPYVIRADKAEEKTIELDAVIKMNYTEPTYSQMSDSDPVQVEGGYETGTVDCSSTKELYTLTSNFGPTNMWAAQGYYLGGGVFNWTSETQQQILKPYRFYMTRLDRIASTESKPEYKYGPWITPQGSNVKVVVLDDEEEAATYINSLSVRDAENLSAPMYDITGRQIVSPVKGQVYIQNGVKKLAK